jgi:hypothetical protein
MWGGHPGSSTTESGLSALRRTLLTGLLAGALMLVAASTAFAAGKPVNIGTPFDSGPPAVAVDNSGDAVIAWANTKDLAGALNFVQYCVLPPSAAACSHSGSLQPADGAQFIDGVQVLNEGNTLVILADVFGAQGDNAQAYEPVQEWQSTDGGTSFNIVDNGLSVTSGILNADTGPLSAVTVPGTGVLGFGWDTAGSSPPTFNAFPLANPPECSEAMNGCATGFASLEPATNPDGLGNEPGHFASTPTGSGAGVMGVFDTLFTNGPLGCAQSFGTAYAYGAGAQSSTNDYNISPGQPNSAWKVPLTQADCNVEYSAVGGGPSGFGILEDNLGTGTVAYHRFDAATQSFDTPPVTVNSSHGELDPSVTQDSPGGVYATYLLGGDGGPIELSYSADGGKTWASGPINTDHDERANNVISSVNGGGQGWVSWLDNGSVFAQSFQAQDAVEPATVSGGATSDGSAVTLDVACASFPCTVTITLTAPETVVIHAASARAAAKKKKTKTKTKTITLGKGKFTLKGAKKLSVKLSGPGKKFLAAKKGHLKISGLISETLEHHTTITKKTLTLTLKPAKKGKKK